MASLKERAKEFISIIIGGTIMIGFILLALIFIKGGVWLVTVLYPWIDFVSFVAFFVSILILLPMAVFKKTRIISAVGFLIVSYIFGLVTWMWSVLIVVVTWGFLGLFIGLLLGGVGAIPVAIIASVFIGEWSTFGGLILMVIITLGTGILAFYLGKKLE